MQGWRVGPFREHLAEPLGCLLAILGGLYEDSVKAVAARGGLTGYTSLLTDAFIYVPEDVVVPGVLDAGDLPDVAGALAPRPLLLQALVDGKNRLISEAEFRPALAPAYEAYRNTSGRLEVRRAAQRPEVSAWLASHL